MTRERSKILMTVKERAAPFRRSRGRRARSGGALLVLAAAAIAVIGAAGAGTSLAQAPAFCPPTFDGPNGSLEGTACARDPAEQRRGSDPVLQLQSERVPGNDDRHRGRWRRRANPALDQRPRRYQQSSPRHGGEPLRPQPRALARSARRQDGTRPGTDNLRRAGAARLSISVRRPTRQGQPSGQRTPASCWRSAPPAPRSPPHTGSRSQSRSQSPGSVVRRIYWETSRSA